MKQEFAEMARNRMSKKQTHTERKRERFTVSPKLLGACTKKILMEKQRF